MGDNEISLQSLSIEQLNSLKSQIENELRQYTTSYSGLKEAHARFQESKSAVAALGPDQDNQPLLIPLTPSMYVPGRLTNVHTVLVDIGTGYYVDKSLSDAGAFMDRKMTFIQKNVESLTELIEAKRSDLEMVISFMQQKLRVEQ